jgi:hypothetical protein
MANMQCEESPGRCPAPIPGTLHELVMLNALQRPRIACRPREAIQRPPMRNIEKGNFFLHLDRNKQFLV